MIGKTMQHPSSERMPGRQLSALIVHFKKMLLHRKNPKQVELIKRAIRQLSKIELTQMLFVKLLKRMLFGSKHDLMRAVIASEDRGAVLGPEEWVDLGDKYQRN